MSPVGAEISRGLSIPWSIPRPRVGSPSWHADLEDAVLRPERTEAGRWAPQQSHRPASMFRHCCLEAPGALLPLASAPALGPPVLRGEGGRASAGNLRLQMERCRQTSVFQPLSRDRHLAACGPRPLARPSLCPQPSGPSPIPSRGWLPAHNPGPAAAARGSYPALITCAARPALGGRGWAAVDAGLRGCPLPWCLALFLSQRSAPWPRFSSWRTQCCTPRIGPQHAGGTLPRIQTQVCWGLPPC